MPPDNAATVAAGAAVDFLRNGPASSSITRVSTSAFNLAETGTYRVAFDVSVTEPGQLMLTLDDVELASSVVGRAAGLSQLLGESLIIQKVG